MGETTAAPHEEGAPVEPGAIELAYRLGWSALSPANRSRQRSLSRMSEFDNPANTPEQRAEKKIGVAYYALELSTPLKPYTEVMAKINSPDELAADATARHRAVDDFLIANAVRDELWLAHETLILDQYGSKGPMRLLTADYSPTNTGCLNALSRMTRANRKLGWISEALASDSEYLLRYLIAREVGLI